MFDEGQYRPSPNRFDEALAPDGGVRQAWRPVADMLRGLGRGELLERRHQADRMLDAEGAGHLVHDLGMGDEALLSTPWRLDPIPVVIGVDEFDLLAAAVEQRSRVLEEVLADLYGARRAVREGLIPVADLAGSAAMRFSAAGQSVPRWLVHHAVDVVRVADGTWRIVGDLTDSPTGLGYALLNRSVMARVMGEPMRSASTAPIVAAPTVLRRALAALAPTGRSDSRTVVLSGGPDHPSFVEQSYLAVQMGVHLADGGDLVVRQQRLWLRALDGLEPVDVVYRRVGDQGLDPLEVRAAGAQGVPAITWAARAGGVVLANAYGAGVLESDIIGRCLPDAARLLLGEELLLPSWSPTDGIATTPRFDPEHGAGLVPGRVVVRLHAIIGPGGVWVMPGGAGRVLRDGDHPSSPTALQSKDVWVSGVGPAAAGRVSVRTSGQVDFGSSVPKRVADSLYFLGRAAERAEVGARTARVVTVQLDQDPALATNAGGAWLVGATDLVRAARALPPVDGGAAGPWTDRLAAELAGLRGAVAEQIGAVVREGAAARQFLSNTTGRVLVRLGRVGSDLVRSAAAADDLDMLLVDLAALSGLAMESTVRGPAWRFLDLGRRLERSVALLGSIEATVGAEVDPRVEQPLVEALLAANESLVAYRRRYRSEIELEALVDLLVRDDSNPRGLAFQLDRIREHVVSLSWPEGLALVDRAAAGMFHDVDPAVSGGRRLGVDALVIATRGPLLELDAAVVSRWFADPVNPVPMGHR